MTNQSAGNDKLPALTNSNPQIILTKAPHLGRQEHDRSRKKPVKNAKKDLSKEDVSYTSFVSSEVDNSMEHLASYWDNANDLTPASSEVALLKRRTGERRKAVVTVEEAGLTSSILRNLASIFREADTNGKGCLTLEQFKGVMKKTLSNDIEEEELELMYMKTDTNCDGTVDWDEYLSFMLLECKGKDVMAIHAQRTFQDSPKSFCLSEKGHKDSVIAILYQVIPSQTKEDSVKRYISIGKDGIVLFWNCSTLAMTKRHKIQSENKMVWITDACLMSKSNLVAVGTTARTINLYDISANKFMEISRINALEACPTCMSYWSDQKSEQSVLLFGDDRGGVTILVFNVNPLKTKIHPKKIGLKKHVEKHHIAAFIKNQVPMVKACYLQNVHGDLVRQIKYIPFLTCFVSCCKDTDTALCMGNIDLQLNRKIIRNFSVKQGVNSFDYCQHLNMIVTGSYDTLIRVWNPYILTRPSSVIYGHQSPIIFVGINTKKEHVISVSETKEVRIHDLNSQNCIQKYYKKHFPDMGTRLISACLFNPDRQDFVLATKYITVLEGIENLWKDPESMSQLDPLTGAIFNPLFNQVVSACWDGTICIWEFKTGKKLLQFKACKLNHKPYDAEITAMAFCPSYRRLLTSSRTGELKIWNFNNGDLLRTLPNLENMEITSLLWEKQRIITGGWSQRVIIYLEASDDDIISILNPYHKEDVMALACYRGNVLASACYNGDIYLWYMETGRLMFVLNASKSPQRPISPREHTGRHVQNPSIYYTHNLEKNPQKVHELIPLPCYLRENPKVDIETALAPDSATSEHGKKESLTAKSTKSLRKRASRYNSKSEIITNNKGYSSPSKRSTAIAQMVFLENRENTASNAVLMTVGMNGIVYAWSIHSIGGLKGSFQASSEKNEPVTAVIYLKDLEVLITGDARGYIRVWDINHYCTENNSCSIPCQKKWQHFTFVKWKRKLYGLGKYHSKFPYLKMDTPHLISAFRGHLRAITWLENVPNVKGQEMFLSTSLDCSIRLWGLDGEFYGVYNQTEYWNLADIDLPHWREGHYTDFENTDRNSIKRYHEIVMPKDIRKVASSTTIVVLSVGRTNLWSKVRNVLKAVLKFKRRQRVPTSYSPPSTPSETVAGTSFVPTEQPLYDLDIPALLAEAERKKNQVERNKILGMTYKKRVNHRPLPKLKIPLAMEPQCAVYRALPYFELEDLSKNSLVPQIKNIRKTHCLPPINREPVNRQRIQFSGGGKNNTIMGTLTQHMRKSLSVARQSLSAEASSKQMKRRGTFMGTPALIGLTALVKKEQRRTTDRLNVEGGVDSQSRGGSATSSLHEVDESNETPPSTEEEIVPKSKPNNTNNSPQHILNALTEEEED